MSRALLPMLSLLFACQGPEGPAGPQGDPGPQGEPGAAGADGLDGTDGADGANGADGAGGAAGADGADGATLLTIESDTVWSTDTYVEGVVYVLPTAKLTVEDGVKVSFAPGAGLFVDGTLALDGSNTAPVTFQAASGLSGGLFGVHVSGTADGSTLADAVFDGVNLTVEDKATARIERISFNDASLTVLDRTPTITVADVTFTGLWRDAQTAILARNVADLNIEDATFDGFNLGVVFDGLRADALLSITRADFTSGTRAVQVGSLGSTHAIVDLNDVVIQDMTNNAITVQRADATLTDVEAKVSRNAAITGDPYSTITMVRGAIDEVYGLDQSCFVAYDAELSQTAISDCDGDGLSMGGDLVFNGGSIARVGLIGIDQSVGLLDLDALVLEDIGNDGVESEGHGALSNVEITGTQAACLDLNGDGSNFDLTDVILEDCGTDGVEQNAPGTLSGVTVTNPGDDCLDINAATVTLNTATLTGCVSNAIESSGKNVVATAVTASGTGGAAINASVGPFTLDKSTISNSAASGVAMTGTATTDSLTVKDTTISDVATDGIASSGPIALTRVSVQRPGASGVTSGNDPATLSYVTVNLAGTRGISISYHAVAIADSVVTASGTEGIYVTGGSISFSESRNNGGDGIYVTGDQPSAVLLCDVAGNGGAGVRGRTSNPNALDVTSSNILGNAGFGIDEARVVSGNHVANNNGQVVVDMTAAGAADGSRTTDTPQIDNADAVTTPSNVALTVTGPR